MKLLIVLIIPFLLVLTLCTMSENYSQVSTTAVKGKNEQQVIKLEDLITLELTIDESSDLREDYLLVRPYDVSINYNDDIVLVDEDKIKIYDKSGKGKKIIGRKGQGPGDFMGAPYVVITPNGFITADEGGGALNNRYYTVFKPDYNILNKWRYYPSPELEEYLTDMNMDFKINALVKIVAINQDSFVYQINFFEKDTNNQNTLIAFEDNKDFKPVFCGRNPFYIVYKKSLLQTGFVNHFDFHILPDNKILYFNTVEDSIIDSNLGYYSFHIFSLETNYDIVYKNKFIPQELSVKCLR